MQWRLLWARRWPILAVALIALGTLGVLAQAANDPDSEFTKKRNQDKSGWLGVYLQDIDEDLAEAEDLTSTDGVFVSGVVDGSPAEDGGLKEGDVILKFGGAPVSSVRRLTREIESTDPGTKIDLAIRRDGADRVVAVEIGETDDDVFVWNFNGDSDPYIWTPEPPDAPMAPRAPRAFGFSMGQLSSPYIGVSLIEMSDQLSDAMGVSDGGALVNQVEKDSPAEKAGLKAGDIIVEIDSKKTYDTDDVRKAIQRKKDGETVSVHVMRKGQPVTANVAVESNDTWSGIGVPGRFHVRPDHAGLFEIPEPAREKVRRELRSRMDEGAEWRDELQAEMEELREQLRELREQLRDLR